MTAVKSGNVEWPGGCARRVVGNSLRESESNECASGMVVNFCCVRSWGNATEELALGILTGANNVEIRFGVMSGARRSLDCEDNTRKVRRKWHINAK
jgi:hypothetical protein